VIAYGVAQRRREIGLRIALGATRREVTRFVMQPALVFGAIGVVAGVAGAVTTRQAVAGLLFGVSSADPRALALVSVAMLAVIALASAIPALRASRVDPLIALAGD
jgi:ABC-type antimicrobial peptide transport system permease subunit